MKIMFISQYFFPEQFSNNRIAKNLSERGHEVEVYTSVPNYPSGKFFEGYSNRLKRTERWGKIHINRVWTLPRGKGMLTLLANYLTFPLTGCIKILLTRSHPDVVFVSQLSPIFMVLPGIVQKWRTGCPLVYWVQDIWPESATYTLGLDNRIIVWFLNRLCSWLYLQADMVMVQSAAFHDMIARFGVPTERIRFLPNTAPENYRPIAPEDAPRYSQLVPQSGFRLMFAGNIGESQDFDTLVTAAGLLRKRKELHWIIVGSGRDEQRVRSLVIESGLADQFHFIGRHPDDDMPDFFSHADAMIVSLKNVPIFSLTVPYKVQCYMACGKPIIASLNGEGARIIREADAGIVAGAGRPKELARAILEMMDAGEIRRNGFAVNSRRYFEANYQATNVYETLENALKLAASEKRK